MMLMETSADGGASTQPPQPPPDEDPFNGTIPRAGEGTDGPDAAGRPLDPTLPDLALDSSGAKPEGSNNFQQAVEAGERARAAGDAAAALDKSEPAPESVDVAPEPVVVDDEPEPEVIDITPLDAFPSDPEPEPMPLPAPVEPPVTEAPAPAPAAPAPAPIESVDVTPERPAGVQDPADLREAAGHYRAAADLLEQAADEIEAGDAALAGESDPELSDGQGGGVDIDDEAFDATDPDGASVKVTISDLEIKVGDGETHEVDVELNGTIDVDATGDDATEAPATETAPETASTV